MMINLIVRWSECAVIFVAVSDGDDIIKTSCQMKQWVPAAPTDSRQTSSWRSRKTFPTWFHWQTLVSSLAWPADSASGGFSDDLLTLHRLCTGGIPCQGEIDDINPLFHVCRQPSMFAAVGEERCLGEMSLQSWNPPTWFTGTVSV